MRPTRSLSDSPSPRMPPEQTLIPASRTAEMVSRRSSYDRVLMTCTRTASTVSDSCQKIHANLGVVLA